MIKLANFTPEEISEILKEFFNVAGKRQYTGARYIPVFGRRNEDTIAWDNSAPYEPLTIVLYQGNSYTSRTYVPTGVAIEDQTYWALTGNYNAQIEEYRRIVGTFDTRITDTENDISALEAELPKTAFSNTHTVKEYIDTEIADVANTLPRSQFSALHPVKEYIDTKSSDDKLYTDESINTADAQLRSDLVPFPSNASKYGTSGQVLTTLANGKTEWQNPIVPTDAQASQYITAWLNAHPEATTTVQDGAVTTPKLANGAVTNPKMGLNSVKTEFDKCMIVHDFSNASFANRGYVHQDGSTHALESGYWFYTDMIDITESINGLYLYMYCIGQNTGVSATTVANMVLYWRNDSGKMESIYIPTISESPTEYANVYKVPNNTEAIRFCTQAVDTLGENVRFKAFLFKAAENLLYDYGGMIKDDLFYDCCEQFPYAANGYLNDSGYFIAADNQISWFTTPLIDVEHYNAINYKGVIASGTSIIAWYDEGGSLLGHVPYVDNAIVEGTADISKAKYLRCCKRIESENYANADLFHYVVYNRSYLDASAQALLPPAMHSVNKPYIFNEKNACYCGDSITQGYTSGSTTTQNGYPKLFSDSVGMTFTNRGVGGASIVRVSGYPCIQDQVTAALASSDTYDYLFIAGGVNDWQLGQTISDFKTALQSICTAIQNSSFPGEVIFIAPISESGRVPIHTPQATLNAFRNATLEIASENNYAFVNGWLFNFPTESSSSNYKQQMFGDNLHPSELGYQLYARGLRTALC